MLAERNPRTLQPFNTLQAQREAAEAYILSHWQEGWRTVPALYDDGGWSGASLCAGEKKRVSRAAARLASAD